MKSRSYLPGYCELQCVSHYSFLRGASSPEQLVARAAKLGYASLAIVDECTMAGVVKAHLAAREAGLKLLIGSQFRIRPTDGSPPFLVVALAMDRDGYGNLCEMITHARTRAPKGEYLLRPADFVAPPVELAHLAGLPNCQLILAPEYYVDPELLTRQARWLAQVAPGRARVALTLHYRSRDAQHEAAVYAAASGSALPVVATGDVVMHIRSFKPVQDTMAAIRHGVPVAKCGYRLAPNAEQHLRSRLRLGNVYPKAALDETMTVAAKCTFSLDELRYEYPNEVVPEGQTPTSYLRQEAYLGARWRYPGGIPAQVQELLEKELTIIADLEYEPYFLSVYDIVRFARSQQILCQGRGSAANSAVCFCLAITEIDPQRGTLLFERFISKERAEPPDIDLDVAAQRREEVIQYI